VNRANGLEPGAEPVKPNRIWLALAGLVVLGLACGGVWAARRPAPEAERESPRARPAAARVEPPGVSLGKFVREGIQVECRVVPLNPGTGSSARLREGREVRFEFAITDTTSQAPLSKSYPSAWMVAKPEGSPPTTNRQAAQKVETLINGSLFTPPELDLNTFHAVTLNHNATITVVDPLFGFGGTKLLALVPLAAPAADWALAPDGRSIFVALPEINQVAVVDTESWKLAASAPGGVRPRRLSVQPDGHYLWVSGGSPTSDDSGVTVLTTSDLKIAARIRTGRGASDLAFSSDSRFAFVANSLEGTVTVIDIGTLREVATVRTGRRPTSIAYSALAAMAYVTDALDGTVSTIDASGDKAGARVANQILVEPGLGAIRFSPDGRLAFAVNPERNKVYVIDPSTNRVIQRAKTDEGPDQVTFTSDFAYIRHRKSIDVIMISLKSAGRDGAELSLNKFPAGESPPGLMEDPPPADSIVAAPGSGAVLVANPKDQAVYYYREGLAAPMGTFNNYKREPRAILVIDRSLRERSRPGFYETIARLDRPGRFDVVFLLDQPRLVHAFQLDVEPDPDRQLARDQRKVNVQPLVGLNRLDSGESFRPLFELTDHTGGGLKVGLTDVELVMLRTGEGGQDRRIAREIAPGVYGADFKAGQPGVYHVYISCDSIGLQLSSEHRLTLEVTEPGGTRGQAPPDPASNASAVQGNSESYRQ
jgi:YVTN family beta-propeller protein